MPDLDKFGTKMPILLFLHETQLVQLESTKYGRSFHIYLLIWAILAIFRAAWDPVKPLFWTNFANYKPGFGAAWLKTLPTYIRIYI